jgi:hypothetical protein
MLENTPMSIMFADAIGKSQPPPSVADAVIRTEEPSQVLTRWAKPGYTHCAV